MDTSKQEEISSSSKMPARRFPVWRAGLLLGLVALLILIPVVYEPDQRVKLPSGYTLVLRGTVFAPETKTVSFGPFWDGWLARIPIQWVPKPLRSRHRLAKRNGLILGGKQGFWIAEDLVPPDGIRPTNGPGSFHHEVVMEEEPYVSQPMSGMTDIRYVICNGDSYPRRARSFRVQIFTLEDGQIGRFLGEFRIRNPHPQNLPSWTPETLPLLRTNGGIECELLRVELAQATRSDRLQVAGQLQLRVRERGSQATNWAASSVQVIGPAGDRSYQARNMGVSNGVVRVGFDPLWSDEPACKLQLELSRIADFPPGNQWTLTITNLPQGKISDRLAEGKFGGGVFGAALAVPDLLEFANGTGIYIESPELCVKASGGTGHFQLRLVSLMDQHGRPVAWKHPNWGGDLYHWPLADKNALSDGGIQSVTATFSWEPKVSFEFLVHPTLTTNFADWPRRP